MILTENGVLKLMQRIKSFITSQLNTKASSVHTHSISEIENLSSQLGGYTKSESDDKFVDKTSNQTISGNKKFTNTVTIEKSGGDTELLVKNTAVDATSITTNAMDDIRFVDQNDNITGGLRLSYETNGSISTIMYARSYSQDGLTYANKVFTITSNIQTGISNSRLSTDFVPDTNNIYNLGSSSLQWNNAYIKSLTINGVAAGDILTHNKSEFVDVVNSQTIDGTKTFVDSVFIKRSNPFLQIRSTGYVKGVAPSDNYYQGIRFYDDETSNSENHIVGGFETQYSTSGYNISNINSRNYDQNNVHLNYSVGLYVPNDNTRPIQFVPSVNNVINIGSPSYQWNNTYTRHILIDNDINIWSSVINKTSNSGSLSLRGGTNFSDGASIGLYGKDYNDGVAGTVNINAYGNSDYTNFRIYPNGTMSVYNNSTGTTKNIAMQEDTVPRGGGEVFAASIYCRNIDNSELIFCGGHDFGYGGNIFLAGKDNPGITGGVVGIRPDDGTNTHNMWFAPDGSLSWDGQPIQYASDQRLKQQISEIDNALLDAWEDVDLVQFKYNDAVNEKGDNARLHTGYVVQQIDEACQKHNIDISEYGLYCHEEYPQETEEVEVENEDGTTTKETKVIREASEHYSLRYTETLVVECAYLRRENARLKERLQQHEDYFSNIEKRLQSLENS